MINIENNEPLVANEQSYQFEPDETASHLPHQQAFQRHFIKLLINANINSDQTGIEIGPGTGDFAGYLSQKGFTIDFVEPSIDAIEILETRYPKSRLLKQSGYEPISRGEDRHFFFALEVIEHCFDPEAFLQNIFNCMAPDEVLIISTPYHGYFKNVLIALTGNYDKHHDVAWKVGHIKFFSIKSLSRMACKVGFNVDAVKTYGRVAPLARGMFFVLRKPKFF
jgi:2-polyprenyl-6-hydroxyphenyl methylase/3-demethylubiquinone-9 3-methyltransferase